MTSDHNIIIKKLRAKVNLLNFQNYELMQVIKSIHFKTDHTLNYKYFKRKKWSLNIGLEVVLECIKKDVAGV